VSGPRARRLALAACCALALAACASKRLAVGNLARARVATDYASYRLVRVGLLPFRGAGVAPEQGRLLQAAFAQSIGAAARFEIVALDDADLEEVPASEPLRRGWTKPATVLALGRRYDLDALLVGTVTDAQAFAPQKLGLEIDLVATETGIAIWSSAVALDASEARGRQALEAWHAKNRAGGEGSESWELALISPRRFAEFAAAEVAATLPRAARR